MIVRRSQMVLDFVLTLQGFHLLFTILYNWHFPTSVIWWVTKFIETAIMFVGGRHFCMVRELRPIEFGTYEMVPTTQQDVERQENGNTASEGTS